MIMHNLVTKISSHHKFKFGYLDYSKNCQLLMILYNCLMQVVGVPLKIQRDSENTRGTDGPCLVQQRAPDHRIHMLLQNPHAPAYMVQPISAFTPLVLLVAYAEM